MWEKFSVAMCVYGGDAPAFFDDALRSVITQTVRPNEIVLTVDGPIPHDTQDVIDRCEKELAGSGIAFKAVYLPRNLGHGEARRACFEHCSHELIALMDADDLSVPERFEKQLLQLSQHPELSVIGGQICEFIDTPEHCVGKRLVPKSDAEIKRYMKKRCPMNQMTVMFRKRDVAAVGGYLDWHCEEDYYLWLRLALAGYRFGNLGENLVNVRVGAALYRRRGGLRYFSSEARLQRFMLRKRIITFPRYFVNVTERFILQVLMPNRLRSFIFRRFARS